GISPGARLFLTTGVMGGFTTYSSFNYETLALVGDRLYGVAALNVAGTVVGWLLAGVLRQAAGRAVARGGRRRADGDARAGRRADPGADLPRRGRPVAGALAPPGAPGAAPQGGSGRGDRAPGHRRVRSPERGAHHPPPRAERGPAHPGGVRRHAGAGAAAPPGPRRDGDRGAGHA